MADSSSNSSDRLLSIDALRGFDMFWISGGSGIIVALADWSQLPWLHCIAAHMEHVPWEGFVFYDMIFPLFLFLAGVSMPFSMLKKREKRENLTSIHWHILKRMLLLVFLGMIYNGLFQLDFDNMRYASVLARIGIAWYFSSVIVLHTNKKIQCSVFVVLLIGYWLLMTRIPYAGGELGVLSFNNHLEGYIDQLLLPGRLFFGTYDPEGILSTLPAIGTAMLGTFAGYLLLDVNYSQIQKTIYLSVSGIVCLVIGYTWGQFFPIIKNIWTSSFVLVAGGWSLILLSLFYYIIDVIKWRSWTFPFVVLGMNSITVYMLQQGIFGYEACRNFFFGGIVSHVSSDLRPVVESLTYALLVWVSMYFLYRNKLFFKV